MFSLQKLLGKEDKFFTLLEASAEEARTSVQALVKLSKTLDKPPAVDEFAYSRRKDKQITGEISAAVYTTFVTALEREDIEDLSKWGIVGNMVWAWVLTIPISGLLAYGLMLLLRSAVPTE